MKTSLTAILIALFFAACCPASEPVAISIDPAVVLSDVSHRPIGINIDYLMDDDAYLRPARSTADALKAMGARYLRYPGGNKSDFYFFSTPPYEESRPALARTGKEAVGGSRAKMLNDDYATFKYDVLDFDEFIQLCRQIDAVPVICVAADEYLIDYPAGCTVSDRETLIEHAARWGAATPLEQHLLTVMAHAGSASVTRAEIAAGMGRSTQSLGMPRERLIDKGIVEPAGHGRLRFTMPGFAEYLRATTATGDASRPST